MIQLFHIPEYKIDTGQFSNLLHDKIVRKFEEYFADYVGARYAVSFNSATSAIFLAMLNEMEDVAIPSILPPVVANAILTANNRISFEDDVDWIGSSYVLHEWSDCKFIDSAQRLKEDQFKNEANDNDLMVFSFYPTKPVGSCDGGIIVSNNKKYIDDLRVLSFNGMSQEENNWEREIVWPGYKMYMNSIQAKIAFQNLIKLDWKKEILANVRDQYNKALGLENTSDHLYRIKVKNNRTFIQQAKEAGIICGLHYQALHLIEVYQDGEPQSLPRSEEVSKTTVSIPFHEKLTTHEIETVIKFVESNS